MRLLLGDAFQKFISKNGLLVPVRQATPLFDEMTCEIGRLNWLGWDKYSLLPECASEMPPADSLNKL